MNWRLVILARGTKGEKVLWDAGGERRIDINNGIFNTSAVLGTASQKISILMSPRSVCNWGS